MLGMVLQERIMNDAFGLFVNVSLHDGDPGRNGASEIAGVGRQAARFHRGDGARGSRQNAEEVRFTNMPDITVTHFGLWGASGEFLWGGAFEPKMKYGAGDAAWLPVGSISVSLG